ncbi:zinc-binding dehydrogenase [Pseudactinotalea sp. HY160]|uniref:quinone oxidoreductase family protein n=1 Tax=Pseudactinotalea sp. HY160 TaxID=2654490 RepID=UPI00128D6D08|nr:quinone oxidoreductase [Pseudactinotalea sp. HY160]MPV51166.1 zinc-binding dehydrogenase [Pseudactinotalea sp. HY160]
MHAIEIDAPGGADTLEFVPVPELEPGPGQIVVHPRGIGVNFYDTYVRGGVYPADFPLRPGSEGAGEVIAVGPGVTGLAHGDRVAWTGSVSGSYAEQVLLDAEAALPVPPGLDLVTAAALPLQGLTAQMLVDGVAHLGGPGTDQHTAFITAGAGGVGQLFIQLARAAGARVLTMVGTEAKAEAARTAGAEDVFVPDGEEPVAALTEWLRGHTGGRGVDVFYDGLGRATFDAAIASTRMRGLVVLFGGASGQVPPFDLQRLNRAGSLFVTRPTVWHYVSDPAELQRRWAEVSEAASRGDLAVTIGATYPLEHARYAHEALEARMTTGKVMLLPA